MARDRKRAKQRKARRARQGDGITPPLPPGDGLTPQQPTRENVPGELDHASAGVDQFEAAIVAGADGQVADEGATDSAGGVEHPEVLSDEDFDRLEDRVDDGEEDEIDERALETAAVKAAPQALPAGTPAPTKRGPGRFLAFLRASWAELQRVQWPDRRQVGQATAVVLGFVVIAGTFLGFADYVANQIVDLII